MAMVTLAPNAVLFTLGFKPMDLDLICYILGLKKLIFKFDYFNEMRNYAISQVSLGD